MADHFTVTESFIGMLDKEEVTYVAGEIVDSSDRALKKWPQHFAPLVVRGQVEQATAGPGEKRRLSLRGKKPRQATPTEEKAIAATVQAEDDTAEAHTAEAEPPAEPPAGTPLTLGGMKGRP